MSISTTISRLRDIKTAFYGGDPIIAKEDIDTINSSIEYLREYADLIIDIWAKVGIEKGDQNEHIK